MENYYKKVEKRFIMAAIGTNDNARQRDVNRNHVNYGYCIAWAIALDDMGHEVSLPVYTKRRQQKPRQLWLLHSMGHSVG
nr:MAG TPA: hypothetical protein [Caudoviricetes sp.]